MSLADVQQLVDDLVRDTDQVITPSQRDAAIAGALARYSVDAPRRVVVDTDVLSSGDLLTPADWQPGQSTIISAEWPVGRRPAAYIQATLIEPYATPDDGIVLVLHGDLGVDGVVRLTYTTAHVLDASADSVPLAHRRALAALAGADLCGQLAAHYSNEGAPTIGADTVDHQGKSGRWRSRARDLAAEYTRIVGQAPNERAKSASADAVLPSRNSLGGRRLFHPPTGWPRS